MSSGGRRQFSLVDRGVFIHIQVFVLVRAAEVLMADNQSTSGLFSFSSSHNITELTHIAVSSSTNSCLWRSGGDVQTRHLRRAGRYMAGQRWADRLWWWRVFLLILQNPMRVHRGTQVDPDEQNIRPLFARTMRETLMMAAHRIYIHTTRHGITPPISFITFRL